MNRLRAFTAVFAVLLAVPAGAAIDGPPIVDSNYRLDLRRGPVVGGPRKVGMGGANIALTGGAESLQDNPAAVSWRPPEDESLWDASLAVGQEDLNGNDVDNNGDKQGVESGYRVTNIGFAVQRGRWGFGLQGISDDLEYRHDGQVDVFRLSTFFIGLGRQSTGREWSWGAGFRVGQMNLHRDSKDGPRLLRLEAAAVNLGLIWRPEGGPLKLGASFASRLKADNDEARDTSTPVVIDGIIVPRDVVEPARLGLGASYRWASPSICPGRPITVAADLIFSSRVDDAVGIASVLEQRVQRSGERSTVGLHAGVEAEVLPRRLRLRLGGYSEPSRFAGVAARRHVTGGVSVRVARVPYTKTLNLGLSYAVDAADGFASHLFSVGFWF